MIQESQGASGLEISKGTYNLKITPQNHSIKEIVFEDLLIDQDVANFIKIDDPSEFDNFVEIYAIDPTGFNFSTAKVSAIAKGNVLMKCKDWNFISQTCFGEWELFKDDLIPGQDYTFTLTPEDPGFGETNVSASAPASAIVCDVSSCPRDATFHVSFKDNHFVHIKTTPSFPNGYMNLSWNNSIPSEATINSVILVINHTKVAENSDLVLRWWNGSAFIQVADLNESNKWITEFIDLSSSINTPDKVNNLLLQYSFASGTGQGIVDFVDIFINYTTIKPLSKAYNFGSLETSCFLFAEKEK